MFAASILPHVQHDKRFQRNDEPRPWLKQSPKVFLMI